MEVRNPYPREPDNHFLTLLQRQIPNHYIYHLIALMVIIIYSVANIPFLYTNTTIADERFYVYAGDRIFNLGRVEFVQDSWPNTEHPFLAKFFIGLSMLTMDSFRFIPMLFGAGSLLLVYLIIKGISGIIASSLLLLDPIFFLYSKLAMLDTFMVFFTLLGLYFLLNNKERHSSLSLTCAALSKFLSLQVLPAFLLFTKKKLQYIGIILSITILASTAWNLAYAPEFSNPIDYIVFLAWFHTTSKFGIEGTDTPLKPDPLSSLAFFIPYLIPDHKFWASTTNVHLGIIGLPIIGITFYQARHDKISKTLLIMFSFQYLPLVYFATVRPVGEWLALLSIVFIALMAGKSIDQLVIKRLSLRLQTTYKDKESTRNGD